MRISTTLASGVLAAAVALLGGACSDDDTPVTAGDDAGTTEPECREDCGDVDATLPDRPADLTGTITSVEPFVPVTEDCTPPDELDPDGAVSSDDPPICTPEDNDVLGTVLVEEDPTSPSEGRKISYTATQATVFDGVGSFDELAEGQVVDTWVPADGACAESYPEQCGLAAIRVTG